MPPAADLGPGMTTLAVLLYLLIGYFMYRSRYPAGVFPYEHDEERERLRRLGRRRVLPLPERDDV